MENKPRKESISRLEALGFVWDVLVSVAVPTTVLALLGRWLDARWGSTPAATIVGLILSFVIAGALVMRKAKAMAERMKDHSV